MNAINKTATLGFFMLLYFAPSFAQNYFITLGNDSVPCREIHFFDTNAQGVMNDF